jgi:hypothetical protein
MQVMQSAEGSPRYGCVESAYKASKTSKNSYKKHETWIAVLFYGKCKKDLLLFHLGAPTHVDPMWHRRHLMRLP